MCIHTSENMGIARLVVDPYTYWVSTSDPDDKNEINRLRKQNKNMGFDEIFETLIRQEREARECVNF